MVQAWSCGTGRLELGAGLELSPSWMLSHFRKGWLSCPAQARSQAQTLDPEERQGQSDQRGLQSAHCRTAKSRQDSQEQVAQGPQKSADPQTRKRTALERPPGQEVSENRRTFPPLLQGTFMLDS